MGFENVTYEPVAMKSLTHAEVKPFRSRLRSEITPRHLDVILQYDELSYDAIHVSGDLVIEGDLDLSDAGIAVLIVDGDLIIHGCLADRNDEENESLILVGGNVQATDLFTWGTLEVHGNVVVSNHLMLLDNACITHIEGDLRAGFAINRYHHCQVGGIVQIDTFLSDADRIESSIPTEFVELDSDEVAGILAQELLEGDDDEDAVYGYYVDCVDVDAVTEWIQSGKSIRIAKKKKRSEPSPVRKMPIQS